MICFLLIFNNLFIWCKNIYTIIITYFYFIFIKCNCWFFFSCNFINFYFIFCNSNSYYFILLIFSMNFLTNVFIFLFFVLLNYKFFLFSSSWCYFCYSQNRTSLMNFSDKKRIKKNQEERIHFTKKRWRVKLNQQKKDNVSFSNYYLVLFYF